MLQGSKERLKRLDCTEACQNKDRATRLALALQIENPESRSSLGTAATVALYSDFLKDETKKDVSFANSVHKALTDLVLRAREVGRGMGEWGQIVRCSLCYAIFNFFFKCLPLLYLVYA